MNRRRRLVLRRRSSTQSQQSFEDRSQGLPYSRPSENSSLTILSTFPRRHRDHPLPSPSASEHSRAESYEGAPSLMSDNGTAFSISPRMSYQSANELAPLGHYAQDNRRPSLPLMPFGQSHFHSEADSHAQTFSHVYRESKYAMSSLSSPTYRRVDPHQYQHQYHASPPSPREYHYQDGPHSLPRVHLPTAPPSPVQLPPLQLSPLQQEKPRDSRMHLSALLD